MWENINHSIFAAEMLLLVFGICLLSRKNNVTKTFIYAIFVFALNMTLYAVPMFYAKEKLGVCQRTKDEIEADDNIDKLNISKVDLIKTTTKDILFKKHICLTSFSGLDSVSEELARLAKAACPQHDYSKKDFEYYRNDGMTFDIVYGFFKDNKYSVVAKDEIL